MDCESAWAMRFNTIDRYMQGSDGSLSYASFKHNEEKMKDLDLSTSRGLWECVVRVLWPFGSKEMDEGYVNSVGGNYTFENEEWGRLIKNMGQDSIPGAVEFMNASRGSEIIERYEQMKMSFL